MSSHGRGIVAAEATCGCGGLDSIPRGARTGQDTTATMKTLLFSSDDIRAIVGRIGLDRLMADVVDGIEAALLESRTGRYEAPPRSGFVYEEPQPGLLEWMPVMESGGSATVKVVAYHPSNPRSRRLPTVLSSAFTFDVGSGHLTTVMDATFATALRTGAASVVASRVLADPAARVLGLIGCGAQAVSQLHGLSRAFPIDRVLIHDVDPEAMGSLRRRAGAFGLDEAVEVVRAPAETVLASSDIVCTQTSVEVGAGPVVADVEVREHLHVNAVGSDFPGKVELPRALLDRALVCPDFRPQAVREGECQVLPPYRIGPDLAELVQRPGHYRAFRSRPTVFDSTGWALEDHVVIGILAGCGRELGLGHEVSIEMVQHDPTNPYGGLSRPSLAADGKGAA